MRSIIRQNANPPALPDFRNLGVVLRILVAVNAGALVAAFARETYPAAVFADWTLATTMVEPFLFLVLAILWLAAPRLSRLPYWTGVGVVALVTLAAALGFYPLYRELVPQAPTTLARWLIWSLLAVAVLAFYFNLRARALSPAITEARLQALQARIRPHFLFNSINAVLSLIRQEPARAEHALQDMADLFRVLMRDNRELAPLADEVELCRQYLELEQLRLGNRLQVEWNVKSMPGDALVPPLVLQPLLENAVYHGIEPSSAPGVVSINLFLTRNEVHAILKNPYRAAGGSHHSGNKMALGNVRERLALHFDAEASLESRVTKDGYEVHIRLPYRRAADPDTAQRKKPGSGQSSGSNGRSSDRDARRSALADAGRAARAIDESARGGPAGVLGSSHA
jgi:two-component system, LytTR family, sensor histidine kinase AlgZ